MSSPRRCNLFVTPSKDKKIKCALILGFSAALLFALVNTIVKTEKGIHMSDDGNCQANCTRPDTQTKKTGAIHQGFETFAIDVIPAAVILFLLVLYLLFKKHHCVTMRDPDLYLNEEKMQSVLLAETKAEVAATDEDAPASRCCIC